MVDVNYGGSTGYGRAYRERLKGHWGVVDVEDVRPAARYLAQQGLADRERLAIRGGSAGGYTTLCALTFQKCSRPAPATTASATWTRSPRDTHKFESRYLDWLVGPYPAAKDLYRERSPIHHTDRSACP